MSSKYSIRIKETFSYLHEPEYASRFARVYWRGLLACAAVLIVLFSMYGIRQVVLLSEIANTTSEAINAPPPFDRGKLETVLAGFGARDARYEILKRSPPNMSDPSR